MLLLYYTGRSAESVKVQTGCSLSYFDLIMEEESKFWRALCKKDLRRLQKLMTTNMGEGHFQDDTDEFDSDDQRPRRLGANAVEQESSDKADDNDKEQ